jgi:site-specific recombinase XerD
MSLVKQCGWEPMRCRNCGLNPVAGAAAPGGHKGGKKKYLCWWCAFPGQDTPLCRSCGSQDYFTAGYCRLCHPHCLSWGVHNRPKLLCPACITTASIYPQGDCQGCERPLPIRAGYCRLCWHQTRLNARPDDHPALRPQDVTVTGWQLSFSNMQRSLRVTASARRQQQAQQSTPESPPPAPRRETWLSLALFDVPRDYSRASSTSARFSDSVALAWALAAAERLAETRGWQQHLRRSTLHGLRLLLSTHEPHELIPVSTVAQLERHHSAERICEVLDELGLLHDDRADPLDLWIVRQTEGWPESIREDVLAWIEHLRHGNARALPRNPVTVTNYLRVAKKMLDGWAVDRHSLREIERSEVRAALDILGANRRYTGIIALRSLFRFLKRTRRVFRDPTTRLRTRGGRQSIPVRLEQAALHEAKARATTPASKVVFALVAVHALRKEAVRHLRLDAVDLINHRLIVNGGQRPLDEFTEQAVLAWLEERRRRWPTTINTHLLITQQTAHETGPVSGYWVKKPFTNATATLERLREDRLLDEVLDAGPDPLHLTAVFGLSASAAERFTITFSDTIESAYAELGNIG